MRSRYLVSFGLLIVSAGALISPAAAPIRVMLLDGESGGPYHAWKSITPVLKRELEETGLFQVDVVTAPSSGFSGDSTGALSGFKPDFDKYQAIVFNYDAPDWPAGLK